MQREPDSKIGFSNSEAIRVYPHVNVDPMVIIMQYDNWDIKWVLIDLGSLAVILLYSTLQALKLDHVSIQALWGSLVGLSSKQMQVRGHITLETTSSVGENSKAIEVNYPIVDPLSPYNVILGRLTINLL